MNIVEYMLRHKSSCILESPIFTTFQTLCQDLSFIDSMKTTLEFSIE